ncbi:trypsin-like peptidase domain-containing protein [Methylocella sp.]|uniref:trypsin-like peptidase domain-containing protein n=1 Tax=Methylocella sp. TaxID=1978226 RepID=UPI0035B40F09
MNPKGRKSAARAASFALASGALVSAFPLCAAPLSPLPSAAPAQGFDGARIEQVVTFGRDSRRSLEEAAAAQNAPVAELRRKFAASGLIECGGAHGAGQLTLTDDLVTTAAHVFFDEQGVPRAKTCVFVNEVEGREIRTPVEMGSIVAGSRDPYAVAAVHDWAVARLARPLTGVTPYGLASGQAPGASVAFVARGHIDWGEGRRLSFEKCGFKDQLSVGEEGTREFSFDCETGDGASGGAVIFGDKGEPLVGAVLVGWRSNKPFRAAPFSPTHYNFAVTIEGAFRKAVVGAAAKAYVAR